MPRQRSLQRMACFSDTEEPLAMRLRVVCCGDQQTWATRAVGHPRTSAATVVSSRRVGQAWLAPCPDLDGGVSEIFADILLPLGLQITVPVRQSMHPTEERRRMEMMTVGGVTLAAFVGGVVGTIVVCMLVLWASLRVGRDDNDTAAAARRDDGQGETPIDTVVPAMNVSIPGGLVQTLRGATYATLGTTAESVATLTSPADPETNPEAFIFLLDRLDGARALLDALGWQENAPEHSVRLNARLHEPLKAALDLALLVAETQAETAGNTEDCEALARFAREIEPTAMLSGEELEQVLERKLQRISLQVAELAMILNSDLRRADMLGITRRRVTRTLELLDGAIALTGVRAQDSFRERPTRGRSLDRWPPPSPKSGESVRPWSF